MKLKNILLSGLSLVLVAALAIGGTVAYLQDDDSDVNVMTLGNVSIAQHEYERAVDANGNYKTVTVTKADGSTEESYELTEFKQAKPLLPGVGEITGYDSTLVRFEQLDDASVVSGGQKLQAGMNNMQDKFVLVENTGKTDAYVRTLFAFELGSYDSDIMNVIGVTFNGFWSYTDIGTVKIDGNNYHLIEAIYNGWNGGRHVGGLLPAGEWTYNSLAQVYMLPTATNEDCEALDGNKNGTYDILVLSQAVQADGFADALTALDTAFGDTTAANAVAWFGGSVIPVYAEGAEQVQNVLENGGELFLQENISADTHTVAENVTVDIDLQGNTLTGIVNNNGEMNVSGGKMEATYMNNYGEATFTDVEMKAGSSADYANISRAGAVTEYTDVTLNSAGGGIGAVDGAKVTFNSGSVDVSSTSTSARYNIYAVGEGTEIVINGGTFSFSATLNQKRAYIYAGAGATVIVNGGEFGPASARSGYTAGILGDGTVIIKGGTFGFDPSAWVADGYDAVQNGSVWTVSAK